MRRRLRFRWILAGAMALANLALLGVLASNESRMHRALAHRPDAYQTSTSVALPATPTKASSLIKADAVLNLPALGGEALLFGWAGPWAFLPGTTAFAGLLWFWIGTWVEDQVAGGSAQSQHMRRLGRAMRVLLRTVAVLFLIVGLQGLTPLYRHRFPESKALFGNIILWCTAYLICSFWGQRRFRKLTRQTA